MTRRIGVYGIVLVAAVVGPTMAQPPAASDNVKAVLAAWQHRLGRFNSVRYTLTGTAERKIGLDEDAPPPSPRERPVRAVVLVDFVSRRIRVEHSTSGISAEGDRYIPRVGVTAFDGNAYHARMPRGDNELGEENADALISRGPLAHSQIDSTLWPVLHAHGVISTVHRRARPDHLPTDYEPDDFSFEGHIPYPGGKCHLLRTDALNSRPALTDEFWVDTEKDGAIIRHTNFNGKNPWLRLDVTYHQTVDGWLPKAWTHTHTSDGRVVEVTRYTVTGFEPNPALSNKDFTLPVQPGAILWVDEYPERGRGLDTTRPARRKYRVDDSGRWIELESVGFTTTEGIQLPPERRSSYWWLAGGGLAAAACVVVAYWLRHRSRRAGTQAG